MASPWCVALYSSHSAFIFLISASTRTRSACVSSAFSCPRRLHSAFFSSAHRFHSTFLLSHSSLFPSFSSSHLSFASSSRSCALFERTSCSMRFSSRSTDLPRLSHSSFLSSLSSSTLSLLHSPFLSSYFSSNSSFFSSYFSSTRFSHSSFLSPWLTLFSCSTLVLTSSTLSFASSFFSSNFSFSSLREGTWGLKPPNLIALRSTEVACSNAWWSWCGKCTSRAVHVPLRERHWSSDHLRRRELVRQRVVRRDKGEDACQHARLQRVQREAGGGAHLAVLAVPEQEGGAEAEAVAEEGAQAGGPEVAVGQRLVGRQHTRKDLYLRVLDVLRGRWPDEVFLNAHVGLFVCVCE
eukprot:Rhum_TRINITY_DN12791_c0_g1::Rhum_TRINITY_DN12791_c0_g1_i1::g.54387::m.54387